jgi:16S rRNA (guanine966-N2)-methyltransferase
MTARAPRRQARGGVRPTSARVRTALFERVGPSIVGAQVLDLFAGSGGLGIEALRRGAARTVFVENSAARCRAIRQALEREDLAGRAEVRCEDVAAAIARLSRRDETFDLIVLDPPYGQGWIDRTLAALREAGLLRAGGLVVAEGHWRDRPALPGGATLVKEVRYGETALWYIRMEVGP